MEDDKKELLETITNLEYYPAEMESTFSLDKYRKIPYDKISSLGVGFEPMIMLAQKAFGVAERGGSGIYLAKVTPGTHLAAVKKGPGLLGSQVIDGKGLAGNARFFQLLDPTMLFMAVALIGINQKLDQIQETQKDILDFLEQKEKSEARGNLAVLSDVMNNYQYNWDNEKYKNSKYILVQDIKRDAEQKIIFYQQRAMKSMANQQFLHFDFNVDQQLEKVKSELKEYQLAFYLFSFSSFLEVMLLENFKEGYLNSVVTKIEDYHNKYKEFFEKCYDEIDKYKKSSIESSAIAGLSFLSKSFGDVASKVPFINQTPLEQNLKVNGENLDKTFVSKANQTMELLSKDKDNCALPFIENINTLNRLYNKENEVLFDSENVYMENSLFAD